MPCWPRDTGSLLLKRMGEEVVDGEAGPIAQRNGARVRKDTERTRAGHWGTWFRKTNGGLRRAISAQRTIRARSTKTPTNTPSERQDTPLRHSGPNHQGLRRGRNWHWLQHH